MREGCVSRQDAASEPLLLLDFRAGWCVQCDVQSELLRRLTEATLGRVRVEQVDIDTAPDYARRYGVHEVPTLILCRGGEAISRLVGTQPYARLAAFIESVLEPQHHLGNGTA